MFLLIQSQQKACYHQARSVVCVFDHGPEGGPTKPVMVKVCQVLHYIIILIMVTVNLYFCQHFSFQTWRSSPPTIFSLIRAVGAIVKFAIRKMVTVHMAGKTSHMFEEPWHGLV